MGIEESEIKTNAPNNIKVVIPKRPSGAFGILCLIIGILLSLFGLISAYWEYGPEYVVWPTLLSTFVVSLVAGYLFVKQNKENQSAKIVSLVGPLFMLFAITLWIGIGTADRCKTNIAPSVLSETQDVSREYSAQIREGCYNPALKSILVPPAIFLLFYFAFTGKNKISEK